MLSYRLAAVALVFAAATASCAAAAPPQLSDAQLVAYATKPFNQQAMMFKHIVVGRYRGAAVVADFPCSDICPQYTTRIIHFDAEPGPACAKVGGVVVMRDVPVSIAVMKKPFCVPAPIARLP